ncbi:hypothetical protein VTK73DRAFT_1604 [Phialemonium thermophilum]|uniref:Uncharacterized protein n=1 Tax=Phialemonium thermophilum TaxID=223376 RepID=A0ABR3Y304_9PEZI
MVESSDIESLLQKGAWTASRAKKHQTSSTSSESTSPVDKGHSRDVREARYSGLKPGGSRFPPSPSVEDEADALAREHGEPSRSGPPEEEPIHRGDVDQHPVLLPVPEFNPERRFVLVSDATDSVTESPVDYRSSHSMSRETSTGYRSTDTNTCKKYVLVTPENPTNGEEPARAPGLSKRKSHQDLPRIDTDMRDRDRPLSSDMQRSKSTTNGGYDSRAESSSQRPRDGRQPGEGLLSPIVQHSTRGRDRAYWDFSTGVNSSASRNRPPGSRDEQYYETRRGSGYRQTQFSDPPAHKRSYSNLESRKLRPEPVSRRDSDGLSKDLPIRRNRKNSSPPASRPNGSPPYPRSSREYQSSRSSSFKGRRPSPHKDDGDSADDHDVSSLLSPDRGRPSAAPRSRSPQIVQKQPPDRERVSNTNESKKPPVPASPRSSRDSLEVATPTLYWQRSASPVREPPTTVKPIVSYRKYLEDVKRGILPSFPDCPRKAPQTGHFDWLTLPRAVNFDICPECYEGVFSGTAFQHSFVPSPLRMADLPITCDFGASPWYKIAWIMTLKNSFQDLHLLQGIATVAAEGQRCPGRYVANRIWYTIMDPSTGRPVQSFTMCRQCARMVEVLLPNLTGLFVPLDAPDGPWRSICAMHFIPGRKRFVDIFDQLETVSDAAVRRKSPPDFQELADRLRDLSLTEECARDDPVKDGRWYVLRPVPDFTVCVECFDEVVWPMLESDEYKKGGLVQMFLGKTKRLPVASCQLYSERMRDVFRKACRRNDPEYLEMKLKERRDIESAIKAKLAEGLSEAETRALLKKWEEWE